MKNERSFRDETNLLDRVRGCLLGVAIGDALGAPFEHLGPLPQKGALPETGGYIVDMEPSPSHGPGVWTDDTGMTLATCRALVEVIRSHKTVEECVRAEFNSWVGSEDCRASGKTVRYACKYGTPDINSWANGALMRTSPVGIYAHLVGLSTQAAATLAYRIARITHGHPLATFPAVEYALTLRSILAGDETPPSDLADLGRHCLHLEPEKNPRYGLYRDSRHVEIGELNPSSGLWMWRFVFEHALGFSKPGNWNSLPGFEEGILKVVNQAVDKDTAGAVAGGLLGAYWGEKAIPQKWKITVRKGQEILELADEIVHQATRFRLLPGQPGNLGGEPPASEQLVCNA